MDIFNRSRNNYVDILLCKKIISQGNRRAERSKVPKKSLHILFNRSCTLCCFRHIIPEENYILKVLWEFC